MVQAVFGAVNPADIATKRLSSARVDSLKYFLGLWCGSNNSLVRHMGPSKHLSSCQSPIKESGQTTDEYIERLEHTISVDTASGMYTNKSFHVSFRNGGRGNWCSIWDEGDHHLAGHADWLWCLLELALWQHECKERSLWRWFRWDHVSWISTDGDGIWWGTWTWRWGW